MVGIGGLFGVAEAYRTTYGSFVYWLGYRALIPKKVRSIRPRVTNVCRSPVLRPVKRAAAITYAYVAQLARAFGSYPKGRWFKPSHRHHLTKI